MRNINPLHSGQAIMGGGDGIHRPVGGFMNNATPSHWLATLVTPPTPSNISGRVVGIIVRIVVE